MNTFKDIATYAVRGNGKYTLLFGALISVLSDIASFAGGLFPIISMVLLAGYLCAVFYDIVNSTATGNDEAPDFPEVSNLLEEVVEPFLHVFGVALVSMGPWLAYWIFLDEEASNRYIFYGLLGFGVIYFPIAFAGAVGLLAGIALSIRSYNEIHSNDYSLANHFVSELGWSRYSRAAPLFNGGLIVANLAFIPLLIVLGRSMGTRLGTLAMCFGIGTLLAGTCVGIWPLDQMKAHIIAAVVFSVPIR